MLIPMLFNSVSQTSKKVINDYLLNDIGKLRITPNSIYIDHVRVMKENLEVEGNTHNEQITKRVSQLNDLFELGERKCVMKACENNKGTYYLKICIKEHSPECMFCYDCFKKISIGYLNGHIVKKTEPFLWKCNCKKPIPTYYFHNFLEKQIADCDYIINKGDKTKLFCIKCGVLTSNLQKNSNNFNILCNKHYSTK